MTAFSDSSLQREFHITALMLLKLVQLVENNWIFLFSYENENDSWVGGSVNNKFHESSFCQFSQVIQPDIFALSFNSQ